MPFRQVVLLADVFLDVEEFELLGGVPVNQLPVPLAHGRAGGIKRVVAVPLPPDVGRMEEQGAVGVHFAALQQGDEAFAIHDLRSLDFFGSRHFQNGREEVFNDDGSGADAFRLGDSGPVNDHRLPDAAFPVGALAEAQRVVGFLVAHAPADGEAAVVRHEDDDGVFIQIVLFQVLPDVAQALVHPLDQGGVAFFVVGPVVAVVRVGVVFRKPLVIAAHVEGGVDGVMGHVQVEGLVRLLGVVPDGVQAFQHLLSQGLCQEDVVFIIVVLIQAADVEVPRAVFLGAPVVRRAADFRAGDVVVKAEEFGIGPRGIFGAEVGLPAVDGGIALFFEQGGQTQHRGKGLFHLVLDFLFRQGEKGGAGRFGAQRLHAVDAPVRRSFERLVAGIRGLVPQERPVGDAVPGGVHAGDEAAPAGGTDGLRIGVREDHALLAQGLHVGRAVALVQEGGLGRAVRFPPEGQGGILPAHVVHQEKDDVGALLGFRAGRV